MKFQLNRSTPKQRIAVPPPAQMLSGLDRECKLEIHALNGAIVVTKSCMTAMDMVNLIHSLDCLTTEMGTHLVSACGLCNECGLCECMGCGDSDPICLPVCILEEAGLPPDCKLDADVGEDGTITVYQADYDHDLTDVPPDLLEIFRGANVCITELEERLMADDIVYNGGTAESSGENDDNEF